MFPLTLHYRTVFERLVGGIAERNLIFVQLNWVPTATRTDIECSPGIPTLSNTSIAPKEACFRL
jgi:hypothetical protein